jgi:hypothetical protein
MQVGHQVKQRYVTKLQIGDFFETPIIADLARVQIDTLLVEKGPP